MSYIVESSASTLRLGQEEWREESSTSPVHANGGGQGQCHERSIVDEMVQDKGAQQHQKAKRARVEEEEEEEEQEEKTFVEDKKAKKKRRKEEEEEKKEKKRERKHGHIDLPLEFWERSEDCKDAKSLHMAKVDHFCGGEREELILKTVLHEKDVAIETNMFPYSCPRGVRHYTLWARKELHHDEIVRWVDEYLKNNMPSCVRWQYDDNMGERSIGLFHVHVYIETQPYCFSPRTGHEYLPPHVTGEGSGCGGGGTGPGGGGGGSSSEERRDKREPPWERRGEVRRSSYSRRSSSYL